ncbi:MAG: hypothetical protein WB998_08505 [Solirubrobacteraceae bacterium]
MRLSICLRALLAACLLALMVGVGTADGYVPATPGWSLDTLAAPTVFVRGASCESVFTCDSYQVSATNSGASPAEGSISPIVMSYEVPAGLTVGQATMELVGLEASSEEGSVNVTEGFGGCEVTGRLVRCEGSGVVQPDWKLVMTIEVDVAESTVSGVLPVSVASVSGGGASAVSGQVPSSVGETPAPFGLSGFQFVASRPDGMRDTQAGDHPYELTVTTDLNNEIRRSPEKSIETTGTEDVKDIVVDLPVGFVGSILAAPQCPFEALTTPYLCPADTRIGELLTFPQSSGSAIHSYIFNMTPEHGVPAEFAYVDALHDTHVLFSHVVPTAKGYVLQTTGNDIPQITLTKIVTTFWGDPALRDDSGNAQVPFFTNPTDCSGENPTATIYMDSWQHPDRVNPNGTPVNLNEAGWVTAESQSPPVSGCNALQFTPELGVQPTTHEADKPSGMEFELKVPQIEQNGVLATPTLKKVVVTLPEGYTVDPSAGDGLGACSEQQIGWEEGASGPMKFNANRPECPEASKIGSLELETPLVPHSLTGEMFLASQDENPYHTTLAAYVVVHDPITGVVIKIAGEFLPDPATGRLTAIFAENPNLPFSDLKLHFFGGPRAELATPEACGTFTAMSELEPWSAPDSGSGNPTDEFPIDEACPTGAFNPNFAALSTNVQAGAYTPFIVSFSRSDTDQELAGLSVTLPPGMLANLSGLPLCSNSDASAGTCPAASQVGTVLTSVGPGPNPLQVTGKAYLTGPYNGGPYGLAAIVPAIAGPFNFGTVIVRQSIRIDPITSQVTDVSDPFPTIIHGIPLRLRRVDVTLDRPGFTFNPTNCSKLAFNGNITGSPLGSPRTLAGNVGYATQPGATSNFTAPFQVTDCAALAFKPVFSVSTQGKTSRANGASLSVKLSYPKAAFGSQANIKSVKVDLPKQLPSRLTTLQKACPDITFNANPASCPAASRVGTATATTPILEATLSGPAYFVSHGGAKFPELVIVLAGQGITVELHGETFISKTGITSSTFRTVPDVPIGIFTLKLPEGSNSALAAPKNLCGQTLKMPTAFTAQNNANIKQNTPINITGCTKKTTKKKTTHKTNNTHKNKTKK